MLTKIAIGFGFALASVLVAGFVERARRAADVGVETGGTQGAPQRQQAVAGQPRDAAPAHHLDQARHPVDDQPDARGGNYRLLGVSSMTRTQHSER